LELHGTLQGIFWDDDKSNDVGLAQLNGFVGPAFLHNMVLLEKRHIKA
jgi:hypothetical protein